MSSDAQLGTRNRNKPCQENQSRNILTYERERHLISYYTCERFFSFMKTVFPCRPRWVKKWLFKGKRPHFDAAQKARTLTTRPWRHVVVMVGLGGRTGACWPTGILRLKRNIYMLSSVACSCLVPEVRN